MNCCWYKYRYLQAQTDSSNQFARFTSVLRSPQWSFCQILYWNSYWKNIFLKKSCDGKSVAGKSSWIIQIIPKLTTDSKISYEVIVGYIFTVLAASIDAFALRTYTAADHFLAGFLVAFLVAGFFAAFFAGFLAAGFFATGFLAAGFFAAGFFTFFAAGFFAFLAAGFFAFFAAGFFSWLLGRWLLLHDLLLRFGSPLGLFRQFEWSRSSCSFGLIEQSSCNHSLQCQFDMYTGVVTHPCCWPWCTWRWLGGTIHCVLSKPW